MSRLIKSCILMVWTHPCFNEDWEQRMPATPTAPHSSLSWPSSSTPTKQSKYCFTKSARALLRRCRGAEGRESKQKYPAQGRRCGASTLMMFTVTKYVGSRRIKKQAYLRTMKRFDMRIPSFAIPFDEMNSAPCCYGVVSSIETMIYIRSV